MWVVFNYPLRSRKVLRVQPHDSSPVSKGLSDLKNQAFYRRINVLWEKKRFIFALWLNLWLSEASFFCHWTTARVKIVKVKKRYTIVSQGKYLSWWFETVFPFLRCCGIKQEGSLTHFKLQKRNTIGKVSEGSPLPLNCFDPQANNKWLQTEWLS